MEVGVGSVAVPLPIFIHRRIVFIVPEAAGKGGKTSYFPVLDVRVTNHVLHLQGPRPFYISACIERCVRCGAASPAVAVLVNKKNIPLTKSMRSGTPCAIPVGRKLIEGAVTIKIDLNNSIIRCGLYQGRNSFKTSVISTFTAVTAIICFAEQIFAKGKYVSGQLRLNRVDFPGYCLYQGRIRRCVATVGDTFRHNSPGEGYGTTHCVYLVPAVIITTISSVRAGTWGRGGTVCRRVGPAVCSITFGRSGWNVLTFKGQLVADIQGSTFFIIS